MAMSHERTTAADPAEARRMERTGEWIATAHDDEDRDIVMHRRSEVIRSEVPQPYHRWRSNEDADFNVRGDYCLACGVKRWPGDIEEKQAIATGPCPKGDNGHTCHKRNDGAGPAYHTTGSACPKCPTL